ncbi:MAG TPA: VCBS repeat-containing protein [Bryobacteraceae bacterium]|nr:VCBS repeat-containing protein [Bryobacteraceae bacterium]
MHRMLFRAFAGTLLGCAAAPSQPPQFSEHILWKLRNENVTGYALNGRTLVTWGDRLLWRGLPNGNYQVVRGRGRAFAEGGCLLDVDGDGRLDIVVNEGGPEGDLVWYRAPQAGAAWTRHVIDTGVDAPDMLPVTLLGHRGVLLIHKRMQVRFYGIPADPTARWPSQDVYSFYSPSHQGGLRMADIDGDGLPDILAGMYWIRSPESFELPWRLFAIELWNETQESAMLRLSYGPLGLFAAQREMHPARLARFEKPADPRQLWIEHRIESVPDLADVNSLDVADFNGDARPDILIAEKAGAGRLLVLYNEGEGRFRPVVVAQGSPVRFAQAVDNGNERPGILAIRRDAIVWFE